MDRFLVHRDPGSLPGEVIGPAAHEAANKRALERAALRSMMHAHLGVRAHRGTRPPTAQFLAATTLIEQLLRWPTQRRAGEVALKTAPTLTRVITFASHSHYRVHIYKLINSSRPKVSVSQVTAATVIVSLSSLNPTRHARPRLYGPPPQSRRAPARGAVYLLRVVGAMPPARGVWRRG